MGVPSDSGQYVFDALQNETFSRVITWKSGPTVATASPVDLTGCSGKAQVKDQIGNLILTFQTGNASLTFGGNTGNITFLQSYATMIATNVGSHKMDLLVTLSDNVTVRNLLTSQPFVITQGVTAL